MLRPRVLTLLLLSSLPLTLACPSREEGSMRAPSFLTEVLPAGEVGQAYHVVLAAHGGTEPRTFGVASLPPGFSFYPGTGVLEGTPRQAGEFPLTFTVQDAHGRTDSRSFTLVIASEGDPGEGDPDGGDGDPDGGDGDPQAEDVFLQIANWNVEWFGETLQGPGNEQKQLEGVAEVIRDDGTPIWALVEIVDSTHFQALLDRLEGITGVTWEGVLASDPSVVGGEDHYDPDEQKPALIWKAGALTQVQADLLFSAASYGNTFAGRPPLRVRAQVHVEGVASAMTFVVVHLKAYDDAPSYERRYDAAVALRNWLRTQPEDAELIVLGDWNDDLDVSISSPYPSPFVPLLEEPSLTFLTQRLTDLPISTTVFHSEPIDHQLATSCLADRYIPDSVWVVKPTPSGYNYGNEISDHYPVRSRFRYNADWAPCD